MYRLFVYIICSSLLACSICYADQTSNGQITEIKKGQSAPYDGYLIDKKMSDHQILVSEEKKVEEQELLAMKEAEKLNDIKNAEIQQQNDALKKDISHEKETKILVGVACIAVGILTGGVLAVIIKIGSL